MNDEKDSEDFLTTLGYSFPRNAEELDSFNRNFTTYTIKGDVYKIDPLKIISRSKENAPATRIDFHKRTVLAAEIVYRLGNEWSMGHLKLQKLLYLCQNALHMPIHAKFLRQALGPYDPSLMRSLDKQFVENKWFKFDSADFPKYKRLEKAGGHREWFGRYYKENSEQINLIIGTFKEMKSDDVELIATIFACWKDCLDQNLEITNEVLEKRLYAWSKEKSKFTRDDITRSIKWMKENNIFPTQ